MATQDFLKWALTYLVPVIGSLAGVLIGSRLSISRDKKQRRHEIVERQLREFYYPILGLHAENQVIYAVNAKIDRAQNEAWRNSCEELRETAKPEENLERFSAERGPAFAASADSINKQIGERVNGNYLRMVTIFRENYGLAEPETHGYFKMLFEYVEISERWTAQTMPREVLVKLDHSERVLIPFFKHLQETHDLLRARLAKGGD